jgi:hypothetical protein
MESGRSHRKSPRAPVSGYVRCNVAGGATVKGKLVNLSTEGIFIKAHDRIGVKERVTM